MRKTNVLGAVFVLSSIGLSLFSCSSSKNEEIVNRALDTIKERVYAKIRNAVSFKKKIALIYNDKSISVEVSWEFTPKDCFVIMEEKDDSFIAKPMPTDVEIEVTLVATATYKGSEASKIINGIIMPTTK